jgi:hypothetical protein
LSFAETIVVCKKQKRERSPQAPPRTIIATIIYLKRELTWGEQGDTHKTARLGCNQLLEDLLLSFAETIVVCKKQNRRREEERREEERTNERTFNPSTSVAP